LAQAKAEFAAISDEERQTRAYLLRCHNELVRLATHITSEDFQVNVRRRKLEHRRTECHALLGRSGLKAQKRKLLGEI
jgi:hypothetical protein